METPDQPAAGSLGTDRLTGVMFVAVYVDDFDAAFAFYNGLLGLRKRLDMGDTACFLEVTEDVGLYLEGGRVRADVRPNGTRASFGLTSSSVAATFARLRDAGVRLVHTGAPQSLGGDQEWFQYYDPAGNIIEIVGPR